MRQNLFDKILTRPRISDSRLDFLEGTRLPMPKVIIIVVGGFKPHKRKWGFFLGKHEA